MENLKSLEERIKLANREYSEVRKWFFSEGKKRFDEFEEKGSFNKLTKGLDIYNELYREFFEKCLEIFDKYDLPNKPKFKE